MKKWLIFLGGFVAGAVVTFIVLGVIGLSQQGGVSSLSGATFFDEPSEVIQDKAFKVMQVVEDNAALVHAKDGTYYSGEEHFHGTLYLLYNNIGHMYYDEEIIRVKPNCEVVQIGIYKYEARSGVVKTVPIIGIVER